MSRKAPLRAAIVGFGKIARDQHLRAISATSGIELVATADPSSHSAGKARYPDLATMLETQRDIDAVIMCQPPKFRFAAAHEAIAAGKHVFLEKPPGLSLAEVEDLSITADEAGVTLFTAWHSQKAAGVGAARAFLKHAGEIRSVRIDWKEDVRIWHPGQRWIWEDGGFGVFDPAINALSILTTLLPGPITVAAAKLDIPSNCAMPIAASLELRAPANIRIDADLDFLKEGPPTWDISFETERGRMVLAKGGNSLLIDGAEQSLAGEAEYPRLYRAFVELVEERRSHVDADPLRIVLEAFRVGEKRITGCFVD